MSVSIRLSRAGRIHKPFYHIGVYDRRTRRDGPPIEPLGFYHPESDKEPVRIELERVKYWLSQGAEASATVKALLRRAGLQVAAPQREKASKPKVSQAKARQAADKKRQVKKRTAKRTASSKTHAERSKKSAS